MFNSNFDLVDGKFVGCCIVIQNFKKFARVSAVQNVARTSIFLAKLALGMFNFLYLLNLHTTLKGHLIKIGTFLQKNDSY